MMLTTFISVASPPRSGWCLSVRIERRWCDLRRRMNAALAAAHAEIDELKREVVEAHNAVARHDPHRRGPLARERRE